MNKHFVFITIFLMVLFSCNEDTGDNVSIASVSLNFSHSWDDAPITNSDFNIIKFTNANGEVLSITKLRYLISRIILENASGETLPINGYNLVDVSKNESLLFRPINNIPQGDYKVSFLFGFNNEDNYNNNYLDLNSASWNVPEQLGGGYHYMQLEGKFIDNDLTEKGYAYHAIRAVDASKQPLKFEDTFIKVNLGTVNLTNHAQLNIDMNVAEWFKNPIVWSLEERNNMLMPNFEAQIAMFKNGQNVFKLKSITPSK
ncbi:MbnP family protein [Cognatitamlana onchidii]|uniref:MbnP family protein n=1 Tax=Cognatitamlana onchidii TaxID=2562860 RepID=UPI0010A667C2|nr:MbnP family protein [Algibacter onchidii]